MSPNSLVPGRSSRPGSGGREGRKPHREILRSWAWLVSAALGLFCLIPANVRGGDDWVRYAQSRGGASSRTAPRNPYILNKLAPASGSEITADHYFDRDSVGENFPGSGGIVRVWEKYVLRGDFENYEKTLEEVEAGEEKALKRKLTSIDHAWLYRLAINRAAKEVRTLYEINCDSGEFIVLEINLFDIDGRRLAREAAFAMGVWYPVEPGSVMEVLFSRICRQPDPPS